MSASSTFSDQSRAGPGRPDFRGRPGINALRHKLVHHVDREVFDALHRANRELGYQEAHDAYEAFGFRGGEEELDPATEVEFLEKRFVLDEQFRMETSVNQDDLGGIGKWIRGAQKQSDWVMYGVHCHESGEDGEFHGHSRVSPPEFLGRVRAVDD